MPTAPKVTCSDYRSERRLEALRRELTRQGLSPPRRQELEAEVAELERALGLD